MKDRYAADVNDYRKYGLLRALTDGGALCAEVCWKLTPGDGPMDGGLVRYLSPAEWGTCLSIRCASSEAKLADDPASLGQVKA